MGKKYEYGINPFQDYVVTLTENRIDVMNEEVRNNIFSVFIYILKNVLNDENDALYLRFKIVNNAGECRIIGLNFPSALWLSGVYTNDADDLLKTDTYVFENKQYSYNKKTNKLTFQYL